MKMPVIKKATEARNQFYETLKEVASGDPQVIIHKGGDDVIMISKSRYNKIAEENEILRAIAQGRADLEAGRVHSHDHVRSELSKMRAKWQKQK
jgi:prevent-host-death family protein